MITNYLKIAFRNLTRYKFISFVNLFGLAIGLTCCLLILTFILSEESYDRFQPGANNTYRVVRTFYNTQNGSVSLRLSCVAPPFGPLLQNDFKQIEDVTRTSPNRSVAVQYNDKLFNEEHVFFADDHFFHFFKTDVVQGNPAKALTDPYSVMMSEQMAQKYFGSADPLNKLVKINFGTFLSFKVTGIYHSFPTNTHFHPDMMISFSSLNDTLLYGAQNLATNWGNNSFFTYIKLPAGYDPKKLEAQFPAFIDRRVTGVYTNSKASVATSIALQKLTDIHLTSHTDFEAEENGDATRVYIFSAIALFILLIACINYMNLSTARSTLRAKEIGIRKTVGAERKEIIAQFLSESVLISIVALAMAFGLSFLLLPGLNHILGQHLQLGTLFHWQTMVPILLLPFLVGGLSGIYPALVVSSFKPIHVLKGFKMAGGKGLSLRKVLVTLQFAISIILIICTGIVFTQMKYMQNKSLGFNKDHVITLPYPSDLSNQFDAFRTELLGNSQIKNVARSSRIPTGRLLDNMSANIMVGDSLQPINTDIKFVATDENFMSTYGVNMVAGRSFSKDFSTDTSSFLVNEAAARLLGFKTNEEMLGRDFVYGPRRGKIIGVFNDFNFESMHQKIEPLVILVRVSQGFYRRISVKVGGDDIAGALSHIESTWRKFLPQTPYESTFLDENFARLYASEQRQKSLFTAFAVLAIFIACLGLFGLSAFAISQRVKEIGIRKVLGADVSTIVAMLSKDFLVLVGFSTIVAFPVAWYFMNKWLQDFAYRISMPWWLFIAAAVVAGFIALFTIGFQAVKAAVANPVKSLRAE